MFTSSLPCNFAMLNSLSEGSHKSMPKFTDREDNTKNYNKVRHLMKNGKKMSVVLWELSLRGDAYKTDKEVA